MKTPITPVITELRQARHHQGLTQLQLGQRLGRQTYQTIYRWENGADLLLSNLVAWAEALGCRIVLEPIIGTDDDEQE